MKTLSKTQYENETNPYELKNELVDIGLPGVYFAKAAINIAKSVQHLIEEHEKGCLDALEIAEKYLSGEATLEECKKAAEAAHFTSNTYYSASIVAYYAAAAAASIVAYYAAAAAVNAAAYATLLAADPAYTPSTTSTRVTACNILKQAIPWNLVCATQIAKCFGNKKDEQIIKEIMKDEKLINYATILLEDENLRKEFEFLVKGYMNK